MPTTVVYICGWGRSGSTLLGDLLGSVEGFIHVGEARYVWDRGVLENWDCGCGEPFSDCELWSPVMWRLGIQEVLAGRMRDMRDNNLRSRHLLFPHWKREALSENMQELSEIAGRLYEVIQELSGAELIVDSSKFPSYAYLLDKNPTVDLHLLHLVRDPRASSYSWWKRRKELNLRANGRVMATHSPYRSALYWLIWHLGIMRVWGGNSNYLRVRYEDFVDEPVASLSRILEFLHQPPESELFLNSRTVRISPQHTVSGNPTRFDSGPVTIEQGRSHSHSLPVWAKLLVTLITSPLLNRYGYPIWP